MTLLTLAVKIHSCQRYSSLIFSIGAGDGPRSSTRLPSSFSSSFAHCSEKNFSFSGLFPRRRCWIRCRYGG